MLQIIRVLVMCNMQLINRSFIFLAFIVLCVYTYQSYAAQSSIVPVNNLQIDAALAKKQDMLLLLLVTLPSCSVCEFVKEDFFEPMMAAGDFDNIAVVRELSLQDYSIIDFDGVSIGVNSFVNRYSAEFAPIVLFLSSSGDQLHKPIIGMSSRDYYGFYLEAAIVRSMKRLNNKIL
jgi:thioredoxin-related protein